MRIGIGTIGLIVVVMMLATVQSATAGQSMTAGGTVKYEDGTTCPYGWDVQMENLNASYGSEPWGDRVTEFLPPNRDYEIDGEYETGSDYFRVWIESPDGKWYGENTVMYSDGYSEEWGIVWNNIIMYPVPVETETFTKSLPLGWNLISLPLAPLNNGTSAVLGNATIVYDAVKSYNAATHQFEDATTMDPGVGYFVHVTTAGTWEYEGTAFTSISATLSTGLNCVGWTNDTGSALPGALSSIDGSYRYVARWNAGTQSYEVYLPGAPAVFNDFATMDRGVGYFIAATSSCTLTYP
jgi:hypothetical protein